MSIEDIKPVAIDFTLTDIQSEMLRIAKHLHDFCEEHELNYIICGGSLLGAIRHHGFIPWDDDFDVLMPREDYEKFKKLWPSDRDLQVISIGDPHYVKVGTPSKLHNPKYRVEEINEVANGMPRYNPYGLFVDIFPLDKYPDNLMGRIMNKFLGKVFLAKSLSKFANGNRTFRRRLAISIFRYIPNRLINFIRNRSIQKLRQLDSKYKLGFGVETSISNLMIGEEKLFPRSKIKFEDFYFYGPQDPDAYLSMRFGDYMEVPDPEHRKAHIVGIAKVKA